MKATAALMLSIPALGVLALPTGTAFCQYAQKQWNKTVAQNKETLLLTSSRFENSGAFCVSRGIPTLTLSVPPRNGTVRIGEADATPKGCPNAIKANGIFYRPNPGFTGSDAFTVDALPQGLVAWDTSAATNVFNVTVK
jgi:hypothetical protein